MSAAAHALGSWRRGDVYVLCGSNSEDLLRRSLRWQEQGHSPVGPILWLSNRDEPLFGYSDVELLTGRLLSSHSEDLPLLQFAGCATPHLGVDAVADGSLDAALSTWQGAPPVVVRHADRNTTTTASIALERLAHAANVWLLSCPMGPPSTCAASLAALLPSPSALNLALVEPWSKLRALRWCARLGLGVGTVAHWGWLHTRMSPGVSRGYWMRAAAGGSRLC